MEAVSPNELVAFLTGGEVDDDLRRRIGDQMENPNSPVSQTMEEIGERSEVVMTDKWRCEYLLGVIAKQVRKN